MDKTRKLRRYSGKDYSQVLSFPVEIMGRNGIVRRCSFESSVRLYQRRIASAPGRYGDADLVSAEIQHCRHRIKQLRASYLSRHGFSDLSAEARRLGDVAGELTAFLRRCFGTQAEQLKLQPLDDQAWGQSWYLEQPQTGVAYLLSLYRFEHYGACKGRESFFETLRVLRVSKGDQVEALLAFRHGGDCGFLLTCQGLHAEVPLCEASPNTLVQESRNGPWAEGLRSLAEDDFSSALAYFEEAQLGRPFARQIAVACGSIADILGDFASAETSARIGLNAFPDDAVLLYQLALALVRGGDLAGARACLERCPIRHRLPQAELLKGIIALRQGRLIAAQAPLAAAGRNHRLQDIDAWIWRLRLRTWALGVVALGGTLTLLFACASLSQGLELNGLLAVSTALLSLAGASLLWWSIKLRLNDETLSELRLPPPEAIGASGPDLGDLVD